MFKVTMYATHISSNGSNFFMAGSLVYSIYTINKIKYGQITLEVIILKGTMHTAHII